MMTNVFDSLNEERVYAGYRDAKDGKALTEALVEMAKSKGMDFSDSLELSKKIMDSVYSYDNILEQVQEDVQSAMEQALAGLESMEPEDRMNAMRQILFGLHLASDEELLSRLDKGSSSEELFREACDKGVPYMPRKEDDLRKALLRKVTNLRLSPAALAQMGKKLSSSEDYVATSAAVGRKGYALKCVVAMDVYLRNKETMDIDEAVLATCETVEMEAIADAVRIGEIAEATAELLLLALTVAILIATIVLVGKYATAGIGKVALTFIEGLLVGCGTWYAHNVLSRTIGEKTALAAGYVKSGVETFQAGMDRICSYMEAESTPAVNTEEAIPSFDVQNVEEYI